MVIFPLTYSNCAQTGSTSTWHLTRDVLLRFALMGRRSVSMARMTLFTRILDIIVSDGENEYYSGGLSESNDHINNIERCQVGDFPAGSSIEIRVSGVSIMEGPQAFALCVSGVDEVVPEPASCAAVILFLVFLALVRTRS